MLLCLHYIICKVTSSGESRSMRPVALQGDRRERQGVVSQEWALLEG